MRIVATKVVEEYWDFEAYLALQVTLALGGDDKPAHDVVVVTDFWTLCLAVYKLVTANVAPSGIIIILLLASTTALYPQILFENRHDFCFLHDERVIKLSERVISNLQHVLLVTVIITRG